MFCVLMLLVVLRGLKYGQNNERQSLFDKEFVNRGKWGPTPNKRVSKQERLLKNYNWNSMGQPNCMKSGRSQAVITGVAVMIADNISTVQASDLHVT